MPDRPERPRRTIALVAHDNCKPDLLAWAGEHAEELRRHALVATGTTGKMLAEELDLEVRRLRSGPLGGDLQLGAMVAEQEVDVLVFFWDPLEPQPHDPDVKALLRIATLENIPAACNRATADLLLQATSVAGSPAEVSRPA